MLEMSGEKLNVGKPRIYLMARLLNAEFCLCFLVFPVFIHKCHVYAFLNLFEKYRGFTDILMKQFRDLKPSAVCFNRQIDHLWDF